MSTAVRAIRGATTVDKDEPEQITERVQELIREMFIANELDADADLVSVIFTATSDLSSQFPATAARGLGLDDVPLLGAQELDVEGMMPRRIRVLVHVNTDKSRADIHHVYLHDAKRLRVDLAK